MTMREEIRRLAEEAAVNVFQSIRHGDDKHQKWLHDEMRGVGKQAIESAILEGVKLMLERIAAEAENWTHNDYWPPEIANKLRTMKLFED